MNAAGLLAFNNRKAALNRTLYPVTIEFLARKGTTYDCAFGEVRNDGNLHEAGYGVQNHRVGALYWPQQAAFEPALLQTFKITACASRAALVGTIWQIQDVATAAHEPVIKLTCLRSEG